MKKWLCLLLAGVLIFSLAGCHRDPNPDTLPIENNGTGQTESTGATQPDNTEVTQPDDTEATQSNNTEETKPDDKDEANPDDKETEENPYAIREVTDNRVKTEGSRKIYDDSSFFSLSFPADWKCLEQQGEDGRSHFFRDPVLGENCQLSIRVTGAVYAKERTPEQYRESLLSSSLQDLIIDSIAQETVQGYKCMKVVYSYTENGTKFIKVSYNTLIREPRLYNFSIVFPADQKDIYEPIFTAIMDSVVIK